MVVSVVKGLQVQCCFTSTKTITLIGDAEPRTAISTFTQLLSTESKGVKLGASL